MRSGFFSRLETVHPAMLQPLDAGKRFDAIDYAAQAVRFGHSLTVIAPERK
jgi:hypothetical protein